MNEVTLCTCTCSYYTCKYSRLLLWHIAAPGAVFSCIFAHKSILTDLQYLLVIQVQLQASNSALRAPSRGANVRVPYVRPARVHKREIKQYLAMRVFTQLQSTRVFSSRGMSASWHDQLHTTTRPRPCAICVVNTARVRYSEAICFTSYNVFTFMYITYV